MQNLRRNRTFDRPDTTSSGSSSQSTGLEITPPPALELPALDLVVRGIESDLETIDTPGARAEPERTVHSEAREHVPFGVRRMHVINLEELESSGGRGEHDHAEASARARLARARRTHVEWTVHNIDSDIESLSSPAQQDPASNVVERVETEATGAVTTTHATELRMMSVSRNTQVAGAPAQTPRLPVVPPAIDEEHSARSASYTGNPPDVAPELGNAHADSSVWQNVAPNDITAPAVSATREPTNSQRNWRDLRSSLPLQLRSFFPTSTPIMPVLPHRM
ncbi:MAG: hypothetical protein SGPRY_001673 [Prymnesium sp.]